MSNWELMAKYLAGECTGAEAAEFKAWLAASAENQAAFEAQKLLWEEAAKDNQELDIEAGLKKLHRAIDLSEQTKRSMPWLRYAAAVAILITSVLLWFLPGKRDASVINETGKPLSVSLPDGSQVWLNQKAELTYPKVMDGELREVQLTGEAYFDIARRTEQPFLVQSGGATIRVLGTEFNVNTKEPGQVQVDVLEGIVALYAATQEEKQVTLEAFEVGRLELNSGSLSKASLQNQNSIAWKTGVLRFERDSLDTVIEYLEDYYDIRFSLATSLEGCTISTVIDNLSLEQCLEVLELTLGINAAVQDDEVQLTGACAQ